MMSCKRYLNVGHQKLGVATLRDIGLDLSICVEQDEEDIIYLPHPEVSSRFLRNQFLVGDAVE